MQSAQMPSTVQPSVKQATATVDVATDGAGGVSSRTVYGNPGLSVIYKRHDDMHTQQQLWLWSVRFFAALQVGGRAVGTAVDAVR